MKKIIDGNVYEIEMLPNDDFGLFKNGNLEKPFCSRREAEAYLLELESTHSPVARLTEF